MAFTEFVRKFGRNEAIGTGFEVITAGGLYQMPQVAAATKLRVKAGNAADTVDGAGARKITIMGLDETGAYVEEDLVTAGASASADSVNTYLRLFRAFVKESGSYATVSAGSHTAAVLIENAAGTADWMTIFLTGYARSQSLVAAYTIPLGYTGTMKEITTSVKAAQAADVIMLKRENILEAAAPYSAMRTQFELGGLISTHTINPSQEEFGEFFPLTDIVFMGKASAQGDVSVEFMLELTNSG